MPVVKQSPEAQLRAVLEDARMHNFGEIKQDEKSQLQLLAKEIPQDFELLKDGSRSKVGRYQLESGREVVLKYYFPKNLAKRIRNRVAQTRCRGSWIAAHGFLHLNLPTPAPLAFFDQFRFGLVHSSSFLATDYVAGMTLRNLPSERYQKIAPYLREAFKIFDRYRIHHGDLKATNILVTEDDHISFIDLDASSILMNEQTWKRAHQADKDRFQRNWEDCPQACEILNPTIN